MIYGSCTASGHASIWRDAHTVCKWTFKKFEYENLCQQKEKPKLIFLSCLTVNDIFYACLTNTSGVPKLVLGFPMLLEMKGFFTCFPFTIFTCLLWSFASCVVWDVLRGSPNFCVPCTHCFHDFVYRFLCVFICRNLHQCNPECPLIVTSASGNFDRSSGTRILNCVASSYLMQGLKLQPIWLWPTWLLKLLSQWQLQNCAYTVLPKRHFQTRKGTFFSSPVTIMPTFLAVIGKFQGPN